MWLLLGMIIVSSIITGLSITCGILEIWIIPYQTVAQIKFLSDIKASYEGSSAPVENTAAPTEA